MNLSVEQLTPDLIADYLYFFDNIVFSENPDWAQCYCYSFHFTGSKEHWVKEQNRAAVISLINENKMKGYLAYADEEPIGWCNANNRLNYQRLIKVHDFIDDNSRVCSIVCFLIRPDFRQKGVSQKMLDQIVNDYASQNYDYLEAYPGKGKLSCEGHYKGPLNLYKKFGFKIKKELKDFYVVRKYLK